MSDDVDAQAYCGACRCWWSARVRGHRRRACPVCRTVLIWKPPPAAGEQLRPGVYAQWSDSRELQR